MTTPTYQLIITHNNQTETLPLDSKQLLKIKADRNTLYKITKDGELIEAIITKTEGDDLYVYLPNEEEPLLLLEEYHDYVPVTDEATLKQLEANLATATEVIHISTDEFGHLGATVFGLAALAGSAVVLAKDRNSGGVSVNHTPEISGDNTNNNSNNTGLGNTDTSSGNATSGSDTTDNGSDTTDNGSDTTDNGLDTTDNGSDTTDNGSDTNDNGSDSTDNGSGTTDNGSDTTDNGSDTTDNGSDTTNNNSDTNDNASDTSDNGSDTTDNGSDNTDNDSDTTDNGSDTTDNGSDTTNNSSDTTDNGSNTTNNDSGTTDNGSDTTDNGSDTTDNGSDTTDNGSDTTNNGSDTTDNGSDTTDNGSDTTDNSSDTTDNGSDTTDNGSDTTDNGSDTTDNGSDTTDNSSDTTDNGSDTTDNGSDTTDNGSDTTDNGSDTTDNGSDTTDNGSDTTDNGSDTTDNSSDTTDNGSDTTDNGSDTSDNSSNTTDNSSDTTDNGSDTTDNGSDTTDNGSDTTDNGSAPSDNGSGTTDNGSDTTDNSSDTTDNGSDTTDNGSNTTDTGSDSTDTTNNPPDTQAPAKSAVTINPIDDGLINQAESRGSFVLSGAITLADGAASPSVTVSINGEEKPAQISDDGKSWRLSVEGSELAKNQGEQTATVKLTTQENGATATTENATTYKVNTEIKQPVITFNKIAQDDIINLSESQQAVKISGNVTNAQAGDKVMLTIGEAIREVEIQADGSFELLVAGEALVNHRSISAKVLTKDEAGNTAVANETKTYEVDLNPPTPFVTLDKVTGDNFISIPDLMAVTPAAPNFTLTGRISDLDADDTRKVMLVLCGCASCAESRKVLETTLMEDGSFKANVDAMELTKYNKVIATVSSSDKAGNVANDVLASQSFTNQLNPPSPTIELDPIAGDNFVTTAESSQKVKITGRLENVPESSLKAQKVVKMQFFKSGQLVAEKDVPFDLNMASSLVEKPPLPSFTYEIDGKELQNYDKVSVTFTNRDRKTYTAEESYVYAAYSPTWGNVSLTNVSTDNVIDGNESKEPTSIVRGTYTANPHPNAAAGVGVYVDLMIHVNGKVYTKRVDGTSGNFEVEVPTRELIADSDKQVGLTAILRDTAGNAAQAKYGSVKYQVKDNAINTPEITIDEIATINAAYAEKNQTTRISGKLDKVDGDVPESNQAITLTVNNREYKAIVQNGKWYADVATSELVAANGNLSAKIAVKDLSGNTAEGNASQTYVVDVTPPKVEIELDKVGGDNVLTATELNGQVAISGKVKGDYQPTDKVKLQLGNETIEVAIQDGTFSQVVSADVLRANSKVLASLESRDEAGNVGMVEAAQDYQVQAVDIQINFANVTTDNLINVTERSANSITVSGTLSGQDVGLAKSVLLTIGGVQYTAELTGTAFSVNVSGNDLLNNPDYRIQAQVLDSKLQVQAVKAHQYQVQDRAAADINITQVGDDALSVGQAFGGIRVSGKVNFNDSLYQQGFNSDKLKTLKVMIGDKEYAAGFNREDFSFHFDVTREEYDSLVGKAVSYKFVTDVTHNMYYLSGTDTHKTVNMLDVKNNAHKEVMAAELEKISVEFDDKTIIGNTVVAVKPQTMVSGEVSGTAKAGDTVEIKVGDKTYSGTVEQNLRFNINVDNADLSKLSGNKLTATLHTKDLSGKTIAVDDVAEISLTDNVKGDFVNPHKYMTNDERVIKHSDPNYSFPYFIHLISPTGSDRGGFLKKMPLGGYNTENPSNPLEPVVIKYYFMKDADYDKVGGYRHNQIPAREAYREFTPKLIELMKKTYDSFNAVSNVRFVEASSEAEADTKLIYVNYDHPSSTLKGAAGIGENGGNVIMNSGANGFGSNYYEGRYDDYTAFHEIYHTLSAKHTDDEFTRLANARGEDQSSEFSIMSGKMFPYHIDNKLSGFSIYDLAFMHYRFGVNQTARAGNDVYGFNHYASQVPDGTVYIWDGAGVDTFDASYEKEGVLVNLTPGSWNYYRSQFSETLVVKEQVNLSASDYARYFAEQNLAGVTVSGTLGSGYAHKEFTKGQSFIGYGTQIENLNGSNFADILIGNKADNNISGGAGNDKIYGGEGNDYLDGGLGNDEMQGGIGNDRYVVDNAGDKVIENENEGEADTVYSSVTYTLSANVEQLYLIGSSDIHATGNGLNNTLVGNDGDNILRGEGGDDLLDGGRGNDTLIGGAGADTFRFSSVLDGSVDTIENFVISEDKIALDKAIFTALNDAVNVQDHILYDSTTGQLSYDADGANSAVNAIHFANLGAGLDPMTIRYEII